MGVERRPEEGQVQRAGGSSQRNRVLGSPAAKRHGHVSKKHGPVRTRAPGCPCTGTPWTCPTPGNTYAGFYCRVSLIKGGPIVER
jgi:hypothetical protein